MCSGEKPLPCQTEEIRGNARHKHTNTNTYTHTHIHTHTLTHTKAHKDTHTYTHLHTHTHTYTHTHAHTHTHTHTRTHAHTHTHTHTRTQKDRHTHTEAHTDRHAPLPFALPLLHLSTTGDQPGAFEQNTMRSGRRRAEAIHQPVPPRLTLTARIGSQMPWRPVTRPPTAGHVSAAHEAGRRQRSTGTAVP